MSTKAPVYAGRTTVTPLKSRMEIEHELSRFGATAFAFGWTSDGRASIQFQAQERLIRFDLPASDPQADWIRKDRNGYSKTKPQVEAAIAQDERSRWRALLMVIKAKLVAVDAQITSFEDEFMAHIVLPNGSTVSEHISPMIAESYERGVIPGGLLSIGQGDLSPQGD